MGREKPEVALCRRTRGRGAKCRVSPTNEEPFLDVGREVVKTLQETLNLAGLRLTTASPLLGAVPELDSMAVVTVITTLEERFGFTVADDEIDGSVFATVGSLVQFVESKLAA
jgi:acyl carrier protein